MDYGYWSFFLGCQNVLKSGDGCKTLVTTLKNIALYILKGQNSSYGNYISKKLFWVLGFFFRFKEYCIQYHGSNYHNLKSL